MTFLFQALKWLLSAAVFFLLFAFALNNQDTVQVHLVFGLSRHVPLVLVILLAFACGLIAGVLGMLPHWWRQRRHASLVGKVDSTPAPFASNPAAPTAVASSAPAIAATQSDGYDYGP